MRDFNIVIAHRGDAMGLWATIHSCEIELATNKFDYSYLICVNGEENSKHRFANKFSETKINVDTARTLEFLSNTGKLGHVSIFEQSISPPSARQKAAEAADGKLLFFFDNHCLVAKDYFRRSVYDFEKYGMDMLHSTTRFFEGDITTYEYKLQLEKNFWAEGKTLPELDYKPYRIAAGGHGGFVVQTDIWREVGGYWDGFVGYGGEEIYFDLLMALLDKTNYIDPMVIHYHYAGSRGYSRHYTDDYYRNMMMCANVIGGQDWLYKVYDSFTKQIKQKSDKTMFDLLMEAELRSAAKRDEIVRIRHRTLDEQIAFFRQHGISC